MTDKNGEPEYAEDSSLCWLSHLWQPWRVRETEYGEDWDRKIVKEQYRECKRCPKYQVRTA